MKNLFFAVLVVMLSTTAKAQEITELEETLINTPLQEKILNGTNEFSFVILETYNSEFIENPIAFMKANFNIQDFISIFKDRNYDTYMVTFKSSRGQLDVNFDKNGKLKMNRQYFYNLRLPEEIIKTIKKDHPGWTMLKNKYFAKGKGELTEKSYYRVKLTDGNKVRRVKLEPNLSEEISLVQN